MDVLILLDKLDDLIYNSKPIPLTDQVRVEREEVYALLDQIRVTLPEEIKQARWIVKERQQLQEPDEDDRQLRAIADSIDELRRSQRPAPPPLTSAAAEKVRSVIEAAEASGEEVRAEAQREARRIEEQAARRGMEMRRRSAEEAAARLKRADDVTRALLDEAGKASADLEGLLDRVRGPATTLADLLGDGATALQADFDRMRATVAEAEEDERSSRAEPGAGAAGQRAPRAGTREEHGRTGAEAAPDAFEPVASGYEPAHGAYVHAAASAETDDTSQPTEEWSVDEASYEEGDEVAGEEIEASLPGAYSHVSAERIEPGEEYPEQDEARPRRRLPATPTRGVPPQRR